jgi:hypothetical protein
MPVNKEESFDKMLSRALQKHSEPVPADFSDRILRQIREVEEKRILARVIMEERLALAGCIVLGIITITSLLIFPGIAISVRDLLWNSIYKITLTTEVTRYRWHSYIAFAGVLGFVVYYFIDLLVGEIG